MREIILDTETTGLSPHAGHRVVEIGCLELINHVPTGEFFHVYINPERDVPREAEAVHGLSSAFLSDKPRFSEIVEAFLEFISDTPLIMHNAEFDRSFLNAELALIKQEPLLAERVIDTLAMARKKFPGAPASLDALCKRFSIDNTNRTKHGALLDSELLAGVYLELVGGRQPGLVLDAEISSLSDVAGISGSTKKVRTRSGPRPVLLTAEEEQAHADFIESFEGGHLWGPKSA